MNAIYLRARHKLTIRENIFDACLLISGKKDEQGYIPDGVIYSDVAYFLTKLASVKHVGQGGDGEKGKLLRDVFFDGEDRGYYKIINESDYKIPIKQIENICEYEILQRHIRNCTSCQRTIRRQRNRDRKCLES